MLLKNKVVLVTGGSRGIGAAIVRRFAREGAAVAFSYASSVDAAEQLAEGLRVEGAQVDAFHADQREPEAAARLVREVHARFGRLDVLVNNAGVFSAGPTAEVTDEEYARVFDVNTEAVFRAGREALRLLEDGGRVVNLTTVVADRVPMAGLSVYAGSKAAVIAFTKAWARELGARRITVNAVNPGPIDTDMNSAQGPMRDVMIAPTALGRYGRAEEVAAAVAFLASDDASYITGTTLDVDGGFNA